MLRLWGLVPRLVRRWIVRCVAPSFTVGAACVIEDDAGSIVLVRLSYRHGWGLPGGLIKRNEDVGTCARREVKEEIDLDVELIGEPAVVVDSRPQRVDVVFRARPATAGDGGVRASSAEILEVRWFPVDDLPELQHEAIAALMALASSALTPEVGPSGEVAADGADGHTLRRAAEQAAGQR